MAPQVRRGWTITLRYLRTLKTQISQNPSTLRNVVRQKDDTYEERECASLTQPRVVLRLKKV